MGNRVKKRGSAVVICLLISVFFFGVVSGMLLIHFTKTAKLNEKLEEAEELEDQPVVNVYVPERKRIYGQIPVNSYQLENFQLEDGFMAYYDKEGNKISRLGVDMSYHQQMVDWEELKNSKAEFVMLRCGYRGYTEGGLIVDEKFKEYAQAANDAGIPLGVYFFTQAITEEEAVEEAEFVISLIEDYEISYPVAFDTEFVSDSEARTRSADITDEMRSRMCIAFCERIREAGYYPIIYAGENWMRRDLNLDMLQEYDFWAPQYLEENDFMYDFTIWQYTEAGFIPGIDGEVDLNISMVDYASFVPALRQAVISGGEIMAVEPSTDSTTEIASDSTTGDDPAGADEDGQNVEPAQGDSEE